MPFEKKAGYKRSYLALLGPIGRLSGALIGIFQRPLSGYRLVSLEQRIYTLEIENSSMQEGYLNQLQTLKQLQQRIMERERIMASKEAKAKKQLSDGIMLDTLAKKFGVPPETIKQFISSDPELKAMLPLLTGGANAQGGQPQAQQAPPEEVSDDDAESEP